MSEDQLSVSRKLVDSTHTEVSTNDSPQVTSQSATNNSGSYDSSKNHNIPTDPPRKTMAQAVATVNKPVQQQKNILHPNKDQAIIVQSEQGIGIAQYLRAMASVIGGKNILFTSRMSLGRVCFYLKSKQLVDSFMNEHGGISIGDMFFAARRLVTPSERLVLSNVCPSIPHDILVNKLQGITQIVSPMVFITLGVKETNLDHVMSFRRQIFVVRGENPFPDSLLIHYEGDEYRIFLSFDDIICYKCKQHGHVARKCPKSATVAEVSIIEHPILADPNRTQKENVSYTAKTAETTPNSILSPTETHPETETHAAMIVDNSPPINIPLDLGSPNENLEQVSRSRHRRKRKKTSSPDPLSQEFEPDAFPEEALNLIRSDAHVLDVNTFLVFLSQVKGNNKPLKVAQMYTQDIKGLVMMLQAIEPGLRNVRGPRERVKRLITRLKQAADFHEATGDDNIFTSGSSISRSRSASQTREKKNGGNIVY